MRIVPCTLVVVCVLFGFSGCQLFEKKNSDSDAPFLGAKSKEPAKNTLPSDPLIGGSGGAADIDGILTGKVVDGSGRPADAQIRWCCLDDGKEDDAQLNVAVNPQGYFMIQGLKTGKRYKLTTRAKSGDKVLEVVTYTTVPDTRMFIEVNEKFAVPASPDKGKTKKSAGGGKEQPASAQIPLPGPGWPQQDPVTLPPVGGFVDKTKIAWDQGSVAIKPPTINLKGNPGPTNGVPSVSITPPEPSPYTIAPGPAPVPSSVKIGSRLENFALYDISLRPWELKTDRRGKIVLLDFWKTACAPCKQVIPNLRILQEKYGRQGLEILGIAYEDTVPLYEQGPKVRDAAKTWYINYQILLGGGPNCPLKRDMQVRAYPTLVLLDENGITVWRHEGELNRTAIEDLEFEIRRRLVQQP